MAKTSGTGYMIGVWLKMGDSPPRRWVYDCEMAKGLVDYAVGSEKVSAWGFFDPSESEPKGLELAFSGTSHKRRQRVKPSDL